MNRLANRLRRPNFLRFSQSLQMPPSTHYDFFINDFEKHKNNMKIVSSLFDSLSIQEKLHWKSYFISEISEGKAVYKNSKAICWLLNERNVKNLLEDGLKEIQDLNLKELSDLMTISSAHPNSKTVQTIISKMNELLPFVTNSEDLQWVISTIKSARALPSFRWNATEKIVDFQSLRILEEATRDHRSQNQTVELFGLIKEFDLSQLSELEVDMLHSIIDNIQDVDPALYLKLTLDLLSHFLFELSSKKIENRPIAQCMHELSLEELKKNIPTLEVFEKLSNSNYDPQQFNSKQLLETLPLFHPLTSLASLSFYDLFPGLAEKISQIGSVNIEKNFNDRRVIDQLFKMPQIQRNPLEKNTKFLISNFSNHLVNFFETQKEYHDVFIDKEVPLYRGEIAQNLKRFKNDFSTETKTFKTPVSTLIFENKYSDLLKLAFFFESCFHYSFPVYFYCSHCKSIDHEDPLFNSFYNFSLELLIYLCKMGRALVKKIKEFDLEKNLILVEREFRNDPQQLKTKILELGHFQENNQMVLKMILDTINSKAKYLKKIPNDLNTRKLNENLMKLKDLI